MLEVYSKAERSRLRPGPALLIYVHIVLCCVSLVYVSIWYSDFHILFNPLQLPQAALSVAALAMISILFTASEFSFGYFVGFYFYTMIVGFFWLSFFSAFNYDHDLARLSAGASLLALLLPALLITSPIRQIYILPALFFARLPFLILLISAGAIILGSSYGFRVVGLAEMYKFRQEIIYPSWLNYLLGISSTALLPFAFACFVARSKPVAATASLILSLLFYPITLNKLALFTPAWLVFMIILMKLFSERTTVVLSLFLPMALGILLVTLLSFSLINFADVITFFGTVNFRMIAIPSSAMDIYNDFFSHHDITFFCQISFLKSASCPYQSPLAVVMAEEYHLGNFNASAFATEGVASIGLPFAPISLFICGLLLALGNRVSAGLPASFVLISSAIMPQVFLNVPFSTILLTHGGACLFLLWYLMPRDQRLIRSQATEATHLHKPLL